MHYIENLLQGQKVEWKTLAEVCSVLRGKRLTKKELVENGEYPVFHGGLIPLGRYDKFNRKANQTMVINTGSVGEVVWSDVDFWSSDGTFVIETNNQIDDKFLYHFLKTKENDFKNQKREGGVPTIERGVIERLKIPIPPLTVQQEIANILDKFTTLEAELDCRKRQYHHYRDTLLTFGDNVEWKTLGEVAEYSKTRISYEQLNEANYVGVDNLLQNRAGKTLSNYVPNSGNSTEFIKNDILIGNIRPYLKKIWQADCIGGTNGDVLVIRINNEILNPRYLYQVLADDKFFEYNMQHAKGAKMPRGNKEAILQYKIPLPPIEEQKKIVNILDKFDTLVNDISQGLPAEIIARRKQYEYYRERLLSFPEN